MNARLNPTIKIVLTGTNARKVRAWMDQKGMLATGGFFYVSLAKEQRNGKKVVPMEVWLPCKPKAEKQQ